jgi:hypothetical protein
MQRKLHMTKGRLAEHAKQIFRRMSFRCVFTVAIGAVAGLFALDAIAAMPAAESSPLKYGLAKENSLLCPTPDNMDDCIISDAAIVTIEGADENSAHVPIYRIRYVNADGACATAWVHRDRLTDQEQEDNPGFNALMEACYPGRQASSKLSPEQRIQSAHDVVWLYCTADETGVHIYFAFSESLRGVLQRFASVYTGGPTNPNEQMLQAIGAWPTMTWLNGRVISSEGKETERQEVTFGEDTVHWITSGRSLVIPSVQSVDRRTLVYSLYGLEAGHCRKVPPPPAPPAMKKVVPPPRVF